MDQPHHPPSANEHRPGRGRLALLVSLFLALTACSLVANRSQPSPRPKATTWLTRERFFRFIEGQSLPLPDDAGTSSRDVASLTLGRGRVESLTIEPEEDGSARVTFAVTTDQRRYSVRGSVSLHHSDGSVYPIVNLGMGWDVTRLRPD